VEFDWYIPAAVVAAFTLLTTLKLTLTSRVTVGAEKKIIFLFHPLWLGALVVEVPLVIGKYLDGTMSPWPVAAFQHSQDAAGLWAGVTTVLAMTTVDLWLFWTTATALLTFTQPMATAYPPIPKEMHKYFHLVNLIAGAIVVYKALSGHPAA
jgi:hypothetical protein